MAKKATDSKKKTPTKKTTQKLSTKKTRVGKPVIYEQGKVLDYATREKERNEKRAQTAQDIYEEIQALKKKNTPAKAYALSKGMPQFERYKLLYGVAGRPAAYVDPKELLQDILLYFDWVDNNAWISSVVRGGETGQTYITKRRPYTVDGMLVFIGMTRATWNDYGRKAGFSNVTTLARQIVRSNQLEGATLGDFNSNIINMLNKLQVEHYAQEEIDNEIDATATPVETVEEENTTQYEMTAEEAAALVKKLL